MRTALKSDDVSGADCCSACHDAIDGRVRHPELEENKNFYLRRAQTRTIRRRVEMGLVVIK
tara:strand:+ start:36 stop:218 length:183 start_codon:yes stop_codon:yes gene_type:complete